MSQFGGLLARHIRLHRELLGLWRLTCEAPLSGAAGEWEGWVARREGLLGLLIAHNSPALAGETSATCDIAPDHPPLGPDSFDGAQSERGGARLSQVEAALAPYLAQLHEGEVRMMDNILRLERQILAAGEMQLRLIERGLCGAVRGQLATRAYAQRG